MNHRLFKAFCSDLDIDASVLLFHTDVRWLSRDQDLSLLTRFFECRMKIKQFLYEHKSSLAHTFKSPNFPPLLAYLANVFQLLNDFNFSVQKMRVNTVTACDLLHSSGQKLL